MIDLHTHILPQMDDGSKSVQQSFQMLEAMARQGVDLAVATPHFYATKESVQSFLQRRETSLAKLADTPIRILPGAEVAYFSGISNTEALDTLCIGQSKLILVEMPFTAWSESVVREIVSIRRRGLVPVLAHIERYRKLPAFWQLLQQLLRVGVLAQCNAQSICAPFLGKRLLRMIESRQVSFIGSDCHNTSSRPPNLQKAAEKIAKVISPEFLQHFDSAGRELLAR